MLTTELNGGNYLLSNVAAYGGSVFYQMQTANTSALTDNFIISNSFSIDTKYRSTR